MLSTLIALKSKHKVPDWNEWLVIKAVGLHVATFQQKLTKGIFIFLFSHDSRQLKQRKDVNRRNIKTTKITIKPNKEVVFLEKKKKLQIASYSS